MKVLAIHAEKLHDEAVWKRVESFAYKMVKKGIKVTFFVYPFRAHVAGKDIREQVQKLEALGHEIGQHTHFYAGMKIDKPQKVNDLSPENIVYCIHRNFNLLCQMGIKPKGFTSGSWLVNEIVWVN